MTPDIIGALVAGFMIGFLVCVVGMILTVQK